MLIDCIYPMIGSIFKIKTKLAEIQGLPEPEG